MAGVATSVLVAALNPGFVVGPPRDPAVALERGRAFDARMGFRHVAEMAKRSVPCIASRWT